MHHRFPREDDLDARRIERPADRAAAAKEPQQQQPGRHRRQHQRQRDDRLEQRLAGKFLRASTQPIAIAGGNTSAVAIRAISTVNRAIAHVSALIAGHGFRSRGDRTRRAPRGPFRNSRKRLASASDGPAITAAGIGDVEIRMLLPRDVRDHAHRRRHRVRAIDDAGIDAPGLDRGQHRAHRRKRHDLRLDALPRAFMLEPLAAVDTGGNGARLAHRQPRDAALEQRAPA